MSKSSYKKVALYPYNRDYLAFIKYINMHHERLQITDVVALLGAGLNGSDAGVILNRKEIGIKVTADINRAIDNCDILLIAENDFNDTLHKQIINTMMLAIESKKDIVCSMHISENDINNLKQKSLLHGVNFSYSPEETHWPSVRDSLFIDTSILYRTQAPVIFIGELVEGLDGFEVLLAVSNHFKSGGYKTVTIGSKSYCEILGIYSMPDFMSQTSNSENDKIYYLNNYIRYLEENENPDIFIIQLPGGMMKYNDKITCGFGTLPYLISQAIQGDYFILSTYFSNYNSEFFNSLSNMFYYRFGFRIDWIAMSNALVDIQDSMITDKLSFLYLDQSFIDEMIENILKESRIPICGIDNPGQLAGMFEHIQKTFSD